VKKKLISTILTLAVVAISATTAFAANGYASGTQPAGGSFVPDAATGLDKDTVLNSIIAGALDISFSANDKVNVALEGEVLKQLGGKADVNISMPVVGTAQPLVITIAKSDIANAEKAINISNLTVAAMDASKAVEGISFEAAGSALVVSADAGEIGAPVSLKIPEQALTQSGLKINEPIAVYHVANGRKTLIGAYDINKGITITHFSSYVFVNEKVTKANVNTGVDA